MIQVDQLSKFYGTQNAVDALSFQARPGFVTGFLGPNGAGKSTTMKMLSTYLQPDAGSALIAGFDILQQPMEVKRVLGYLPEHNPLYLDLYVKESLGFIADLHHIPNKKARIDQVIELTGLGPEQHKKIGALSKGYRQRVGLAQAIIHDPQVLILDEPTSGLDPNQVVDIRNLIKELGKTKTVLVSTHIMQEVEALCEQVIILSKGRKVADHSLTELIAKHPGLSLEQIFTRLTT